MADLHAQWAACRAACPVQTVLCGGHRWALIDTGAPAAQPALLLLPGALGLADTSFEYILAFAPERRVLALDYPATIDRVPALTAGMAALLEHLHVRAVDVVGGSFSGLAAQYFAAAHPACVRGLLLSNTGGAERSQALGWRLAAHVLAAAPAAWLHAAMQHALGRFLPTPSPEQRFWRDYFAMTLPTWPKAELSARARLLADMHAPANAAWLAAQPWPGPALIVQAENDRLSGPRQQESLRRRFPQAQHVTIGGKGHVASLDSAAAYIGYYREFLCSLPVPA